MLKTISLQFCFGLLLVSAISAIGCGDEPNRVVGGTEEQIQAYEEEAARVEAERRANPMVVPE